jgi:hypothetical protein
MNHDIPGWFMPEGEHVLANDHETEEIEETGELEEPLCPHCGNPYLDKTGNSYTHRYVEVESDMPGESSTVKPGVVCAESGKRAWNGYRGRTGSLL